MKLEYFLIDGCIPFIVRAQEESSADKKSVTLESDEEFRKISIVLKPLEKKCLV
ncbi:hypothetical protein HN014_15070 [Aquimarina sp. TRL1]|uniref:hypothetical protein n=1 Tax=Aquimarina sp. (strain TRL1) TaxID=2736252 RepID=UPI00158C8847|nr:hypothetical protein [Aquimarina sp. TRL1]QKX06174.1 hypothetical protein HN014_15070 [Aquimarina sp. TRL1]